MMYSEKLKTLGEKIAELIEEVNLLLLVLLLLLLLLLCHVPESTKLLVNIDTCIICSLLLL